MALPYAWSWNVEKDAGLSGLWAVLVFSLTMLLDSFAPTLEAFYLVLHVLSALLRGQPAFCHLAHMDGARRLLFGTCFAGPILRGWRVVSAGCDGCPGGFRGAPGIAFGAALWLCLEKRHPMNGRGEERDLARRPSALRTLMVLSRPRLLATVGLSAPLPALSLLSLYSWLAIFSDGTVRPSAGDAIAWLFMGNRLGLTTEWGALWCLVLALSVGNVRHLVAGAGVCHVVACDSRGACWRDLCLATTVPAVLACLLPVVFAAVLTAVFGGGATLAPVYIATASLGTVSEAVTRSLRC